MQQLIAHDALMNTLKKTLSDCVFRSPEESALVTEIYDGDETHPFCKIEPDGASNGRFVVYFVDVCIERGKDVRYDDVQARDCSISAAGAIAKRLRMNNFR